MKTLYNARLPVLGMVVILSGSLLLDGAGQPPAPARSPAPSLVSPGRALVDSDDVVGHT